MTPQERQLMLQLFDRLATLENSPRDPDAEAMIREGFRRAPNAAYALVQTVLVQDEALKAANAHIQEYEQQYGTPQQPDQPRGFLDSMRGSIFGSDAPRGSVPRVPQAGAPIGRPDPWGQQKGYQQQGYQQQGYQQGYQGGAPMQAPPQQGGGSSFLGTAAAVAAGAIGGSLLMGGIRSALGGHQSAGGPFSGAMDSLSGRGGDRSPASGNAAGSDLSRDAGLNDISGRPGSGEGAQRAGLLDSDSSQGDSDDAGYDDSADDAGSDDSDSDTA
jgi:hypothetical protein